VELAQPYKISLYGEGCQLINTFLGHIFQCDTINTTLTFKIEHVECDSSDPIRASKICWTTCYWVTLQKFSRKREGCGSTSVDDTFLDKLFISGSIPQVEATQTA
jgi:hypothetical protein